MASTMDGTARAESLGIKAVDLFCGAGGFSHGLLTEGIDTVAGYDTDLQCKYPYEYNNLSQFVAGDVTALDPNEVRGWFDGAPFQVLAGCPPCQAFSTYTQARKVPDDSRWRLIDSFVRIVTATRPNVVALENVPSVIRQPRFWELVKMLRDGGYHASASVVQCADYGVPQLRKRLILLASRHGNINLKTPIEFGGARQTVRDAIADLPTLSAGEVDPADPMHSAPKLSPLNLARIRASKPGGTWRDWPESLRLACHVKSKGRSYPSIYGRMSWLEPSPTITTLAYNLGSGRFGHPEQDRAMTLREAALLQTFPHGYKFVPDGQRINVRAVGRMIGNAVPVVLGRAIGRSILDHVAEIVQTEGRETRKSA